MGYIMTQKIYEDEIYVSYSYSHDSDIKVGIIKIKKEFYDGDNFDEWYKNNLIELKPSVTDFKSNHFAMNVILFLAEICGNENPEFPDKKMFAYG